MSLLGHILTSVGLGGWNSLSIRERELKQGVLVFEGAGNYIDCFTKHLLKF